MAAGFENGHDCVKSMTRENISRLQTGVPELGYFITNRNYNNIFHAVLNLILV